jgi:hypothetical protein
MRRMLLATSLGVLAVAVPAQAKPDKTPPGHQPGHQHACVAHNAGYNATATLVSAALTSGTRPGHFNGSLQVNVTRANHRAPTGMQGLTLTDARVRFGHGLSQTNLPAGSVVKLHGKITELPKSCSTAGFTPTITITKVDIRAAAAHH